MNRMQLQLMSAALEGNGQPGFSEGQLDVLARVEFNGLRVENVKGGDYARERAVAPDVAIGDVAVNRALLAQAKKHMKLHIELLTATDGRSNELDEALRYAKMSLMYLNVHLQDGDQPRMQD